MSKEKRRVPRLRFPGFTGDWEQRKLSEVTTCFDNLRVPVTASDRVPGKIPYYGANGIQDYVSGYTHSGEFVLIAEDGANDLNDYPIQYVNGAIWVNNHAHVIAGYKEKLENKFLSYSLKTVKMTTFIVGGGRSKLNLKALLEIPISMPNYDEQCFIGKFIETIDKNITLHQRKLNHLILKKKSLLQKLFPKNGGRYPELRFPGFTDAWEQRKFKDLFIERREKTIRENEETLLSCAITGIYLNSELFSHFRGSSTIGYLKIKKYDLILSAQNLHLGNANINLSFEKGMISPAYKVFELKNIDPYFINAWVKKDSTKNFFLKATTEGASQCRKNIEWDVLLNQEIPVPNNLEQRVIGKFINNIDMIITLHQRKLDHLQLQKKALLQQMFV